MSSQTRHPKTTATSPQRSMRSGKTIEDLLGKGYNGHNQPVPITENVNIYYEIRNQIHANQGQELPGMLNRAVLKPLVRMQTSKWQDIAKAHVLNVASITETVAIKILGLVCKAICNTSHTKAELEYVFGDFLVGARERALDRLRGFCNQEANIKTNNPHFLLKGLTSKMPPMFNSWAIADMNHADVLFEELHSTLNTEHEIHDLLQAYYEEAVLAPFSHPICRLRST